MKDTLFRLPGEGYQRMRRIYRSARTCCVLQFGVLPTPTNRRKPIALSAFVVFFNFVLFLLRRIFEKSAALLAHIMFLKLVPFQIPPIDQKYTAHALMMSCNFVFM